ncbi:MAG: glycosyltransferase family 4 protein [Acidobacteria bacterium]|nr:glycosyltransferase family 4 protein [Acidobacteriota bacterium]
MEPIYFDARFIRLDYHDGISRFSVELINALAKNYEVVAIIHDQKQLDYLPKGINSLKVNSPESASEFFIANKLNRVGAKLVYSPMQVMGSWGRKYRLVLTLHDLIYYRHRKPPQDLNLAIRILWRLYHLSYLPQRILLNRADAVVTVSETTKKLIKKHRLTRKPVEVIYNAVTPVKSPARTFPTTRDVLYIGSFMPYKNVETLIRGVGLSDGFTLHLLSKITVDREKQLQLLAKSSNCNVVFHRGVSDEKYKELLSRAFALLTASKDEGFGIPLIEAMAQGTPVLVSDLEIFREVAQEAGTYFDPLSPEQLANRLNELADKSRWLEKSKASMSRAKFFSWEESAEKLARILSQPNL